MTNKRIIELKKCFKDKKSDENAATIVSNERDFTGDSYIDEAFRSSFAPLETAKSDSFSPVYPKSSNQDPTRENINEPIKQYKSKGFPLSGLHEPSQEIGGTGFVFASKMKKYSYTLDMSYDITDLEKQKADKAVLLFDQVIKDMYKAYEYLDLIKEPFEKDPNISTEEVLNIRAELREYRDNILDKFNIFKGTALQCLNLMEAFDNDTQTLKLIKVFISSIEEIETGVNELMNTFSSLNDPEFVQNIIKWSENIQSLCDSLEDVIYNRIVKHIKTNILAKSWADTISSNE